jgi:hypothetical protein
MNFPKNKKRIYIFLILLIFIIIGIILYIKMKSPAEITEDNGLRSEKNGESYKLDISILQSDFFEGLSRYGKYPIEPRFSGRKNPFEPY